MRGEGLRAKQSEEQEPGTEKVVVGGPFGFVESTTQFYIRTRTGVDDAVDGGRELAVDLFFCFWVRARRGLSQG